MDLKDWIRKIKTNVPLVSVVGELVQLRKSGSQLVGLCPFHQERSPSFSVSDTKNLYHCYGCRASGDLISFVMETQGLSFTEAIRDLSARAGLAIPSGVLQGLEEGAAKASEHEMFYRIGNFVSRFFRAQLEKSEAAKAYLARRKISDGVQKLFLVGYAENSWDSLSKYLEKTKVPATAAESLGLIRPSQKTQGQHFDLFRARIMFPIVNGARRIEGFGGRLLPGSETSDTTTSPKYLNSPDSAIYSKSRALFGLFQARKHIRERDQVYVVEGFFDVLAMHELGFPNTVATCGTALTSQHLAVLSRLAEKIVLVFDSDRAGQDATERAMELALKSHVIVYGPARSGSADVTKDPAAAWEEGGSAADAFREKIAGARPLLDLALERGFEQAGSDTEARAQAARRAVEWLNTLTDPIGRELRVQAVRLKFQIDLRPFLKKSPESVNRAPQRPVAQKRGPMSLKRDVLLIQACVVLPDFAEMLGRLGQDLPPGANWGLFFEEPSLQEVGGTIFAKVAGNPAFLSDLREHPDRNLDLLFENIPKNQNLESVRRALIAVLVTPPSERELQVMRGILVARRREVWARFSQALKSEVAAFARSDDRARYDEKLKEYLDVQRKLKEFVELI